MKSNNRGFTLLEMLAALFISAIIIIGLYGMFTSVLNTRAAVIKKNENNMLLMNMRRILKADMLQLVQDSLALDNSPEGSVLKITTNNSIKLEKAMPVDVEYLIEDGWLIRTEKNSEIDYEWTLRLLPDADTFLVLSHNGYRFTEDFDKSDTIIQMSFRYNKESFKFTAGCAVPSEGTMPKVRP